MDNKEWKLKSYPKEGRGGKKHIEIHQTQLKLDSVSAGNVAVRNHWVSVDPYVRWFFRDKANLNLNETIPCFMVGEVVKSANARFKEGDMVTGHYGVSEYSIVAASALRKIKVDTACVHSSDYSVDTACVQSTDYLGLLGIPGMTAWVGLELIGPDLTPGKKVFVSAAMDGVGIIVGQLAKIKGCHVVGSVGTDKEIKMLKEDFKFDDAFNHNVGGDFDKPLRGYFPKGIDIYFDNFGVSRMLESVLNLIKDHARIVICGMTCQYIKEKWQEKGNVGVRNLFNLVEKSAKMEAFLFDKYMHRKEGFMFDKYDEFLKEMEGYIKEKKIKRKEDVKFVIKNFEEAFDSLFSSKRTNNLLLHLIPKV